MKLLVATVVLATALGLVRPQCFSPHDDFSVSINPDLSGIADFGLELYRELAPSFPAKNLFFSPYSIWTAFTLAYFGTAGETKTQLQRALRVEDQVATLKLWRELERAYLRRQRNTTDYTFSIANRAYMDQTLHIRQCILNLLNSEVERVDFGQAFNVAARINNFASVSTNGLIPEIVSEGDLALTRMALVNAAYFKSTWKYQFDPSMTFRGEFYTGNQRQAVNVQMMRLISTFKYGKSNEIAARVLELPYSGDAMSMFILLPTEEGPQGFDNMVSRLNGNNLQRAIDNLNNERVEVHLPKFKMDIKIPVHQLISGLQRMGITDIFNRQKVNLTTFGDLGDLTLEKVIHKAFVDVNEEGTEAAAVTVLLLDTRVSISREVPFHCNHPFAFFIRDNHFDNILFFGAYKDPATAIPA